MEILHCLHAPAAVFARYKQIIAQQDEQRAQVDEQLEDNRRVVAAKIAERTQQERQTEDLDRACEELNAQKLAALSRQRALENETGYAPLEISLRPPPQPSASGAGQMRSRTVSQRLQQGETE